MKLLDNLEKKYGKYAIRELMKYIVIINFAVYLITYVVYPEGHLMNWLVLDAHRVMSGEVWRLITFIFIPPKASTFWILFTLYFYYMIGNALEDEWGSFKFNIFYLTGIVGTIIATFISGGASTAEYLNLSLFLAFAFLYPNYELMLFFVLPIKVKYLAALDLLFLLSSFFSGGLTDKLVIFAALANIFLFFGKDALSGIKTRKRIVQNKKKFKDNRPKVIYFHRCCVCGATEKTHPNMEFRYCVRCEGHHEYCMDHLFNHEHVKED